MKDRKGTTLKKGDQVTLVATVTDVSPTGDPQTVNLESVYGRNPDGLAETFLSVNSAVLEKNAHPVKAPQAAAKGAKGKAAAEEAADEQRFALPRNCRSR